MIPQRPVPTTNKTVEEALVGVRISLYQPSANWKNIGLKHLSVLAWGGAAGPGGGKEADSGLSSALSAQVVGVQSVIPRLLVPPHTFSTYIRNLSPLCFRPLCLPNAASLALLPPLLPSSCPLAHFPARQVTNHRVNYHQPARDGTRVVCRHPGVWRPLAPCLGDLCARQAAAMRGRGWKGRRGRREGGSEAARAGGWGEREEEEEQERDLMNDLKREASFIDFFDGRCVVSGMTRYMHGQDVTQDSVSHTGRPPVCRSKCPHPRQWSRVPIQ